MVIAVTLVRAAHGNHRPNRRHYPPGFQFMNHPKVAVLVAPITSIRGLNPLYRLLEALILMSTPAGRLSLFKASIVLAVACMISISRL